MKMILEVTKTKPSYWICGAGGNISGGGCPHWDDVNGCWLDYENVEDCQVDLDGGDDDNGDHEDYD